MNTIISEERKPVDLLVTFCSHRAITAPTVQSLNQLRLASMSGQVKFTYDVALFVGDALISRSRSQACTKFLENTQVPYMLFVDDDIVFTPQDVDKIYNNLKSGQYDLIGGIYPVRGAQQLASYGWGGKLDVDGKVNEVEFLATGFMGISRRLVEKMQKELELPILNPNDWSRCYPFFEAKRAMKEDRERGGDSIYISEDWDFCSKARKVGVRCFVDTSVKLGHLREDVFTCEGVLANQQQAYVRKTMYGAMEHQYELMKTIDIDLSEFLKVPLGQIHQRLNTAQGDLGKEWHAKTGNSISFYKNNETYLFDLAMFNRDQGYYENRLQPLLARKGEKILDIGCGIGTLVFMMAEQGNEVIGWDINQKAIDFCRFRKQKYNLGGEFTTEKPDFSQFTLITAVDMLEHIEDLQGFLIDLGKGMKQGVKLYHSDYFPKGQAWPMHYEEHADKLNEYLRSAGLIPWDERWTNKI